jgi:hypothetical protein
VWTKQPESKQRARSEQASKVTSEQVTAQHYLNSGWQTKSVSSKKDIKAVPLHTRTQANETMRFSRLALCLALAVTVASLEVHPVASFPSALVVAHNTEFIPAGKLFTAVVREGEIDGVHQEATAATWLSGARSKVRQMADRRSLQRVPVDVTSLFDALTAIEVLLVLGGAVAAEAVFLTLYLRRTKGRKPEEAVNRFETRPIQPHDWDAVRDKKTGMFYFVNKRTGVSQWEPPEGFREV